LGQLQGERAKGAARNRLLVSTPTNKRTTLAQSNPEAKQQTLCSRMPTTRIQQ